LIAAALIALFAASAARAAVCGGTTTCQCGDDVASDYTMAADLGPCPRIADSDTVGLALRPGVTLDCQGHAIIGPADNQKNAFGVKVGSGNSVDSDMTVRQCQVTGFWWGIYVKNAADVLVEDSHLYANGWKDPTQNGTGYGIDVASSQDVTVRNNLIADNGNEGFHLSASTSVTVQGNLFRNNGLEQLYLINASGNVITGNHAEGGSQGLEMRFSSSNQFSYNAWTQSAAQVLENDDSDNEFFYEQFDGRVTVGPGSNGNRFLLGEFANPTGACLSVDAVHDTYVYKGHFAACGTDLVAAAPVVLDRSINNLAKVPRTAIVRFAGCTADSTWTPT
jgi:parallel beta-helix repeat protein